MEKIGFTKAGDMELEALIKEVIADEKTYSSDFRWCMGFYVLPSTVDNSINRILKSGIISGMAGFLMNGTMCDPEHRDYYRFTLDLEALAFKARALHKAQGTVLADLCWAGKDHNLKRVTEIREKYGRVDWSIA